MAPCGGDVASSSVPPVALGPAANCRAPRASTSTTRSCQAPPTNTSCRIGRASRNSLAMTIAGPSGTSSIVSCHSMGTRTLRAATSPSPLGERVGVRGPVVTLDMQVPPHPVRQTTCERFQGGGLAHATAALASRGEQPSPRRGEGAQALCASPSALAFSPASRAKARWSRSGARWPRPGTTAPTAPRAGHRASGCRGPARARRGAAARGCPCSARRQHTTLRSARRTPG